ncbi:cytochrome o ubiquinol oxidase subunit III [Candidatus Saccharibacteria bacterium]|nr:cytochrome o ubiquinol oxidase subunit III [Candidatus Saccharibacteria bacterium]HPR09212.1 cytochrome o ubiquinol oxidase subunit III [Candidatus Saccharibacteria bacterium]
MSQSATAVVAHSKETFGFWLYLMTDCLVFATLFATFAVLRSATAGGVTGADIFSLPFVLTETMVLLASSFAVGMAVVAANANKRRPMLRWLAATGLLGAVFLGMELWEFTVLYQEGHIWTKSAFLSSYFGLVGTHGLHILTGLIWLAALMGHALKHDLSNRAKQRILYFSLFWHFLDVIWICIFTVVYLMGVV